MVRYDILRGIDGNDSNDNDVMEMRMIMIMIAIMMIERMIMIEIKIMIMIEMVIMIEIMIILRTILLIIENNLHRLSSRRIDYKLVLEMFSPETWLWKRRG